MGRIKSNKLLKFSLIIFVYAVIFSFLLFNLPEYIYTEDIGPKNNIEPGENNESGDDEEPGEDESGEDEKPGDDEEPGEEPGPEKNLKPHPIMKCSFPDIDTVNFDGSQSFDNDGTIVSYSWNFGDGNTGSGMTAAHTYSESGIYCVTLTITDNEGLQNSINRNVNIRSGDDEEPGEDESGEDEKPGDDEEPGEEPGPEKNLKPHPIMKCSFPDIDTVNFDGSDSFDADGTIIYYHWDFGDGSTGSGMTAAHTYSESVIYRVTLTITDNEGLQNSCEKNVNIKSKKPHPIMQYTFLETDRATVNFDGSQSFDNDGTIVSYSWDFGDANTGRGSIITHTFDTPGIYRVTLTVTDNDGLENSCEKNVNIKSAEDEEPEDDEEPGEEPGPGESKKPEENKPEKSKEVKESKKPDNNKKPEDNKGAGKKDIIPAENAASATEDIKHVENVSNAAGDIKHVENSVAVVEVPVPRKNKKPHAKIEYSFSKTNANTVYINGSGSFDADGTIIYYHWDFGDGNTESRTSSIHTYSKPGQYRITLTVTDNEGLMNSTSRTISIKLNKINNTDNNYAESAPHNNREEKIKNMGRNLNEFKDRKVSPPEEPGDLTLKINDMFKKLLNVKQDKNVDTLDININSIEELLDIQKITEKYSLKEVIDLDELVDINYERDRDKYRDSVADKKIKLPEFLLNFWNKFKELVTL